ncbi:MAG: glycosyl transferase [Oscillospiraceae bacterium]|nr:glycosyl transferase [Oscillospiraceae bacterium]
MANGYKKILRNKNLRLTILRLLRFVPDRAMLKLEYRIKLHKKLDLENPRTFNEKLQWLKLYNRKPIHTTMVDKVAVKEYVSAAIGEEYVVKTLGVWDRFADINFDSLPDRFVLKCNHDSGSVVLCRDKKTFDKAAAEKLLSRSLGHNAYYFGREWPYKDVKPRILAEEYLQDGEYAFLPVYKVFCFRGEPKIIQTIQNDKQPNETVDYFDTDWNQLDIRQDFPNSVCPVAKPEKLVQMLELAGKLSGDEPYLRIDFYVVNGALYFSEINFFTDAGFGQFYPESWDETLGRWLELPEVTA